MTNEQLFKLLGNTDDALLDENVEVTTAAPKRRWIAWTAAAAACVCLCAVGAKVLPEMLPRSEEMTAATGDDTLCNNFWVPLENGIRYETVFCGTELEDPANFQAIQFILDPWHMEYQIIDPMAGGNAEIERGTYTVENGICTLISPDGKVTTLEETDLNNGTQWELKVLSCDSYPDYAGFHFTSKLNSLRPYEGMNTPDGVNADGVILNEAQTAQFRDLLDAMIVYQSVSVPADAPGRENAVRFSFLDQSTEDGLYTGITLFDQWLCYDDGTGWLADAAQVAELMALYEEVQASSAADAEGWYPFAEMDASEIPAAAVYYPSADAQEIQYLEKEVPVLVAMLQEFTAYGQCTATPEMGDTPYSIQFEYADGRYLQIGIYSEYLYISDSLGDTIYAADPEDCAALIEWMDVIRNEALSQSGETQEPNTPDEVFTFVAEITAIDGYLVTVGATINVQNLTGHSEEPSCLYTFSTEGLLMHDANGAEIALSDFAVGDTVYVSYTGEIQESDPAVIVTPTKLQLN